MELVCGAVTSVLLLWPRPESRGEAGGDPGEATEGSDLYQNEEGEKSDIISSDHERPCANVRSFSARRLHS